jgi:hypothetical protein
MIFGLNPNKENVGGSFDDPPAGLPFREVFDGVKRKGRCMGGCPRPLVRTDK